MKTNDQVIARLREFTSKNCNSTIDPKLCDDIRYLCDEVERYATDDTDDCMDTDYKTIQQYKAKLAKCQKKLMDYEPF